MMGGAFETHVNYPSALNDALKALEFLKRSLEKYKQNPKANPYWVSERQKVITSLEKFIEASKQAFYVLEEEEKTAFRRGFHQGKQKAERELHNYKLYGELRFDRNVDKEQIRAATIVNAFLKWDL